MSDYIKREWRRLPFSARAALLMLIPALCLGLTLTALAWDTDLDGFEDGMDSNPVSRAVIPWGAPELVTNDFIVGYPWPGWLLSAFKTNGEWRTNPAAWHVPAAASNDTGWLNIEVDRAILTNDVVMQTHWLDATGAVLYVDLYDAGGSLVVTNVYTNNLLAGSGTDVVRNVSVPLESHPNAVGIRLRRGAGEVTVFESLLYVDQDGDGLDADQERQLGTSDHNPDSDGDGYPDFLEVFGYGTDPANAASFPTVTVSGTIAYAGSQGGAIRVVAVTSAGSWTPTAQTTLAEPGAYTLGGVPLLGNVWIKAWRDSNGNAAPDSWEAWGAHPGPLHPPAALTGIDLALADPDSDGDGLSDWLELYLGADPGVSNAYSRLPFVDHFETDTVQAGPLHGQNNWEAAPTNQVLVQTNAVPPSVGGVQALRLATGSADLAAARHLFVAPTGGVVWLDFHVTATLSAALTGQVETSAALYFDEDGRLTVYDGFRPAGTEWVALTNHAPVAEGQWVRLTLGLDYGTGRWLVGLDGARVAQGLGFSRAWPGFMAVKFEANEQAVDNLTVAGSIPADLDLDGDSLPDVWELQHFGATDQSPTGDGDHDGMSNVQEYEAGTDPSAADSDRDGVDDLTELLWNRDPNGADTYAALPWSTDFEPEQGCTNGALGGQQGWIVTAGTATVQSAVSCSNAQAVALRADAGGLAVAGKLFASVTNPVVWSDYRLKPGAGAALPVDLPARATAVFGVNTQQFWACRSGSAWVVATNTAVAAEAWAHVTLREDFLNRRWDLYVGRDAVLTNLLFADADADHFSRFAFIGWGDSEKDLDCLNLGANPPGHIDMDGDGLSNDEELPLGTDPANADTDLDGMDDRTELQWGFDPLVSNACSRIGANSDTNVWITGFEPSEGYGVDPLDGQNGWIASAGVTVVDSERHAGAQAVAVPLAAETGAVEVMRADIGAAGQTVGWVTLYLKGADGLPDTDADASQSAVVGLYAGRLHAFDGVSGAWVVSGRTFAADSNGWVRVDLRLDYRARQYLVFVNGLLALERVNFRNAGNSALSRFAVAGAAGAGATAYVDDVRLSAAEPSGLDYDEDGLDDVQEHQLGTDPAKSDTDGDGLSDYDEVNLYLTNPLDVNSYPTASISGVVSYAGPQTGVVHVVATTEPNSWDQTWSTTIAAPGAYTLSGARLLTRYWMKVWQDSNGNGSNDFWEAHGVHTGNPFLLSNNVAGVDVSMTDPDIDGDGIPDWWELKNCGTTNVSASTDRDNDLLGTLDEYRAGTNPNNADTDGDGVSDYEEACLALSDPLTADWGGTVTSVCELDGSATNGATGDWNVWGGEIYSLSRRGSVDYTLSVSESAIYRLEVEGFGTYMHYAKLMAYVDGNYVGKNLLTTTAGSLTNTTRFYTPWLTNGTHTLRLFWDNVWDAPQLHLTKIRLQQVGTGDWMQRRLNAMCSIDSMSVTSKVSPACIEGQGWFPTRISITGGLPAHPAPSHRWYANVPLVSTGVTTTVVAFQDGARVLTNRSWWAMFNVLAENDTRIRQGDALLLNAVPAGATDGTAAIQIEGLTNFVVSPTASAPYTFAAAGTYTVVGVYSNNGEAVSNAVQITVVNGAFLSAAPAVRLGRTHTVTCPDLPSSGIVIEHDLDTQVANVEPGISGGVRFDLGLADADDRHDLVARLVGSGLGEGLSKGPILASTRVDGFWIVATVDGVVHLVDILEDGTRVVMNRLTAGYLPPSVTTRLSVFGSGVTFDDGTIIRNITVTDLSELGEYPYLMMLPATTPAPCHLIEAYQGADYLGR